MGPIEPRPLSEADMAAMANLPAYAETRDSGVTPAQIAFVRADHTRGRLSNALFTGRRLLCCIAQEP